MPTLTASERHDDGTTIIVSCNTDRPSPYWSIQLMNQKSKEKETSNPKKYNIVIHKLMDKLHMDMMLRGYIK